MTNTIMNKYNLLLAICIIAGIALRLIWPMDMEWKYDQKLMVEMANDAVKAGQLPEVGMKSGGGMVNPNLSVAPFALVSIFTSDPIAHVMMVQWSNVLAILLLLLFVHKSIPKEQQLVWYSGIALLSVSPLPIVFSRDIWAQCMLPIFIFPMIIGHYHRKRVFWAFLWGLLGSCIGQIHMSGFFLSGGLVLGTFVYDYLRKDFFCWWAWLAGSILGAIRLIWWLPYAFDNQGGAARDIIWFFKFNSYKYFLLDGFGVNLSYNLQEDMFDFIQYPRIGGLSTYFIALAHLFLISMFLFGLYLLYLWVKRIIKTYKSGTLIEYFKSLDPIELHLLCLFGSVCTLLPLTGTSFYGHYIVCTYPFVHLFVAKLFSVRYQGLYAGILVTQMFISISFLGYIHVNGGAPTGEYGKTYKMQMLEQK